MSALRILLAAVLALSFVACGDDEPKDIKTYKKKGSDTMKKEGTALSEEEKQRREQAAAERKETEASNKRLSRAAGHLTKAKDSFEIAEALAEFQAEGARAATYIDRVEKFVDHEDAEVRAQAIKTVASVKGVKAREMLERILNNADEDEYVRTAAIVSWTRAGLTDSGPIEALLDDIDPGIQREALKYLMVDKPTGTRLEFIRGKLSDLAGPAAKLGLQWLMKRRDQIVDLPSFVVEMLDHQDSRTRALTVALAGDASLNKYAVAEKFMRSMIDDPNLVVRKEAQKLLTAWAGSKALPSYDAEADEEARRAAVEKWLSWLSDNEAKFPKN
ncbi:MAG: HEAT repeat domain-containing protein [Planctomycetota bacterium]